MILRAAWGGVFYVKGYDRAAGMVSVSRFERDATGAWLKMTTLKEMGYRPATGDATDASEGVLQKREDRQKV